MQTHPFSRPFDVSRLGDGNTRHEHVEATPRECDDLARFLGTVALRRLQAEVALTRHGRQVWAEIHVRADIIQTCVVTLDNLDTALDEEFSLVFDPDVRPSGEFDEPLSLTDDDPPEPLVDETVDAGVAVGEMVALALDPWPRRPGAEIDGDFVAVESVRASPFAVLKSLKEDD